MTQRRITLLIFVLFTGSLLAADEIPVLTVCEVLSDFEHYQGRSIIVVGRQASTDEGSWLNEDCGLKVVRGQREFSAVISTSYIVSDYAPAPQLPTGFLWDEQRLKQKVVQLKRTTKLRTFKETKYNDHWFAIFGRLETVLPHKMNLGNGRPIYIDGFGHLNGAPAELISPVDGSGWHPVE